MSSWWLSITSRNCPFGRPVSIKMVSPCVRGFRLRDGKRKKDCSTKIMISERASFLKGAPRPDNEALCVRVDPGGRDDDTPSARPSGYQDSGGSIQLTRHCCLSS